MIVAAIAVAPMTPMPGMVSSRRLRSLARCWAWMLRSSCPICSLQSRELLHERLQGLPHRLGQLPVRRTHHG